MSNGSGTWTGSITWWHSSTGNLLGDSVTRTLSPTSTSGTPLLLRQHSALIAPSRGHVAPSLLAS